MLPVAPPVFAYWMQVPGLEDRLGPVRLVLSGSAPLDPDLTAAFTARTQRRHPPGLRPHRGGAGRHLDAVQQEARRRGRWVPRCPGSRSGWSTRTAGSRTTRTAARSRSAAPTCSPATGPTAPTAPTPTAGGPTGDVGYLDPTGDLYLVDRLKELVIVSGFNVYPSEVEDVITELPDVAEAAVIGVEDEETGEAVVAFVKPTAAGRERQPRGRRTPPLPGPAGPVQAALGDPRGRRAALHPHGQGAEGPAAGDRAAPSARPARVSRRDHPDHPLLQARLPPVRRGRARSSSGSAPTSARRTTWSTSPPRPS